MSSDNAESFDVFFSYSHRDEALRDKLDIHLALLKRESIIRTWHDRKILAGSNWEDEVYRNLESADLILLLISPNFIASDFCFSREMDRALERHASGKARVVPIILKPTDWKSAPFAKLEALPRDGKAITTWGIRDSGYLDVVLGIRAVLEELRRRHPNIAGTDRDSWTDPILGVEFVHLEPGTFWMGSPRSEGGHDNEWQHRVILTREFWMSRTPVTQNHFKQFIEASRYVTEAERAETSQIWDNTTPMERNVSWQTSGGLEHPVVHVSWNDAKAFCRWLSEACGTLIRLPTEAEWEYGARAGSKTATYAGDLTLAPTGKAPELEAIAWYSGNSENRSHPVAQRRPNGWGLYDMLGNVLEWVEDAAVGGKTTGTYEQDDEENPRSTQGLSRVIRGGGWLSSPWGCRAAFRSWLTFRERRNDVGFRLVRE